MARTGGRKWTPAEEAVARRALLGEIARGAMVHMGVGSTLKLVVLRLARRIGRTRPGVQAKLNQILRAIRMGEE